MDSSYFKKIEARPKNRIKFNWQFINHMGLGIYIALPIFLLLTFGIFLDKVFLTRPKLTLSFLFLGVVASFYNLYKLVKENAKN